jgi:DNA-binding response OmpR family regulator
MKQATGINKGPTAIVTALSGIETSASFVGTVLSISPIEDDHDSLEQIFGEFRWTLHRAITLPSATAFLASNQASVVICERDLGPGTWKDILAGAFTLPQPPCVIVTSRLEDEYLWAEALNVGAYDVLVKPFEATEVIRIVSLASRSWHDHNASGRVLTTRRMHAA